MNKYKEAIECYNKAIEIDPNNLDACLALKELNTDIEYNKSKIIGINSKNICKINLEKSKNKNASSSLSNNLSIFTFLIIYRNKEV